MVTDKDISIKDHNCSILVSIRSEVSLIPIISRKSGSTKITVDKIYPGIIKL